MPTARLPRPATPEAVPAALALILDAIEFGEGWREVGATGQPSFANSWVNFGVSDQSAAFYKDALGIVHIKGLVKSGTPPSTVFTLPDGYRPALNMWVATVGNGAFGYLRVTSAGAVDIQAGSTTWTSIECSFRAA